MPLKDTMRRRSVAKRGCVAERGDGESPEARLALRATLPLTPLTCWVSQSSSTLPRAVEEAEAEDRSDAAAGGLDAPVDPMPVLGRHKEWTGPRGTCHLSHLGCVRPVEHGSLLAGCQGEWEGGKGDPHETPRPASSVGGGIGVGAWESHGQQDEDWWRRPLACGKTGPKVPRERARYPRGTPRGAGEMGRTASWEHGEGPQVLSRIP
jgi:hypothetical protein